MTRALLAALAALALAPAAAAAQHGDHGAAPASGAAVSIEFAAFDPPFVDVLRGDRVTWDNVSVRQHDVAAADGSFNSGVLRAGATFTRAFDTAGEVAYYCPIHPFMRGTVSVHDLLLDRPAEPAVPGRPFPLHGRTALAPGTTIGIEADGGTGSFTRVASTTAQDDGTFSLLALPHISEQLRAVADGATASPPVPLLVLDRAVTATGSTKRGRSVVRVRVTPAGHGGTVVLQLRLRERFGWWPVGRAVLDRNGRARFRIKAPRRVRARVVLTLADGATPLAVSAPLRLGRG
jgi:plastocyanin